MHTPIPLRLIPAHIFLAVLIVSGCTQPPASGKGVSLIDFGPDHPEVYSREPVTFRLLIRNEGYVEAKNAHAELLGIDEDWCSIQSGNKCTPSQGKRLEMLPNEDLCRYTGNGFNLLPADRQAGTHGQEQICTWTYNAPPLDKGFKITYTPVVRVFYSYKSAVTKLITFGSSSEIRRIRDSGGSLPSETTSSTEGPVQISIETKGPIRFWEQKVVFPVEITIKNVGNGAPCARDSSDDTKKACKATVAGDEAKNKARIKITMDRNMKLLGECAGFEAGVTLPLYKGQNSFVCDMEASGLNFEGTVQKTIKAEALYEYFFDATSSITVIGRE
ncbi:MAG: hypothetical protein QXN71_00420 [Candidatus Aenigmatarchaeota archaeon]